jgi:hypothetical protein
MGGKMSFRLIVLGAIVSCVVFSFERRSSAAIVNLPDFTEANANDSNNDGVWDTLYPGPLVSLLAYNGVGVSSFAYNIRAALQFDISSIPQSATISSATLLLQWTLSSGAPGNTLQFNGYVGTGTIQLSDFAIQNSLALVNAFGPSDGTAIYKIPATAFVQSLVSAHDQFAGFTIENVTENQTAFSGDSGRDPPDLEVTYSVPEPSAIVILLVVAPLASVRRMRRHFRAN